MYRAIRLLLLPAAVAALICGCKSKENTPEDAKLKGNSYTNRFFGFGLEIPKTWTFPDKPSKRQIRKGMSLWGFDKETSAAAADATAEAYCLLLTKELWSGMSLVVMAQDVRDTPEVRTGKDVVEDAMELIVGEGKPFQQVGEPVAVRLGKLEFYGIKMTGDVAGRRQYQGMFVAIEKGYALLMMPGAETEKGLDEVLRKIGMQVTGPQVTQASQRPPGPSPVKLANSASPEPEWLSQVRLQGISGSDSRRFAIINGKTFAAGDADKVKTSARTVMVRCLAIKEASVMVTVDGVEGEWELQLVKR
jgi:hypothetical protein